MGHASFQLSKGTRLAVAEGPLASVARTEPLPALHATRQEPFGDPRCPCRPARFTAVTAQRRYFIFGNSSLAICMSMGLLDSIESDAVTCPSAICLLPARKMSPFYDPVQVSDPTCSTPRCRAPKLTGPSTCRGRAPTSSDSERTTRASCSASAPYADPGAREHPRRSCPLRSAARRPTRNALRFAA